MRGRAWLSKLAVILALTLLGVTVAVTAGAQSAVPALPTGLAALSVTHDAVMLAWDDPGDDTITGYEIRRRDRDTDQPGVYATIMENTGTAAVSYVDESVEPERRYVYRVVAINAHGKSIKSRYLNVDTPSAPEESSSTESELDDETVWSATLDVGTGGSTSPPALGYSLALEGTLSENTFTLDGTEHRVELLFSAAGGLYFGMSTGLQTDFTLHVGDRLFESAASSTATIPLAAATYWWDDSDLGWSDGDTTEVSLRLAESSSTSTTDPAPAPLSAYFRMVPDYHNGVDEFTFRVNFVNDAPTISYKTMRDHSLDIEGGTIQAARRVTRGSNRIWAITVVPDGDGKVFIALPAGRACDSEGAVCKSDGTRLHNRPEVVVPIRPTEPPPPPINLRATAQTDGTVDLSWDAPDDDSITGYQIMRRHPGESPETTVETLLDTDSTDTTYSDNASVYDVVHAYYVKAVNAAGSSQRSNYDNATPFEGAAWEFGIHLPIIYLTFDDGPSPPNTNQVLDLLEQYGARATFFVNGARAAPHQGLLARMAAEGHSVGNHAWQHERLVNLSHDDFNSTITRTQDLIGEAAAPCLRPPYGDTNSQTYAWAGSLGLRVVMWTVEDKGSNAEAVFSYLDSNVQYRTTVLMHDTGQPTVDALRVILERWARKGYEFKPVCEPPAATGKPPNTLATGSPAITGMAQVGQTLTSEASAITDRDGLDGVTFLYQWLADSVEIADATGSSYAVGAEHEGKSITVRVSFIDNAGNQESKTSVPTAAVAEAEQASGTPEAPVNLTVTPTETQGELTVSWDPPDNNNGSEVTGYEVEWRLSADYWGGPDTNETQTTDTSYTITGLTEASQYAVRVRALNEAGSGAASTETLATPLGAAPLIAEFGDIPASHTGSESFTVRISFNADIANGYIQVRDRSVEVTGGMVLTASRVDTRKDLWEITILPSGTDHVIVVLPTAADCATWGHICTSDEKKLSNRLQLTVPGP